MHVHVHGHVHVAKFSHWRKQPPRALKAEELPWRHLLCAWADQVLVWWLLNLREHRPHLGREANAEGRLDRRSLLVKRKQQLELRQQAARLHQRGQLSPQAGLHDRVREAPPAEQRHDGEDRDGGATGDHHGHRLKPILRRTSAEVAARHATGVVVEVERLGTARAVHTAQVALASAVELGSRP